MKEKLLLDRGPWDREWSRENSRIQDQLDPNRPLSHCPVTKERVLRVNVNIEVCIKGGRELRSFLMISLFYPINKKHDYLIEWGK